MEEKQIITAAVDSLTGKKVYSFTLYPRVGREESKPKQAFWQRIMGKRKERPDKGLAPRTFDIYPCVVANQYRIAAKALSLPSELFDDPALMLAYVQDHLPTLVYIIAAAITNTREEPEQELTDYLTDNMDNEDIVQALNASLQQTNMQSFMTSIVLMNGTAKILEPKASPIDGSGLIASHTQA